MLKAYDVEELREGMKVGRDIAESDGSILFVKGTVLTTKMIESMLDRPIFSVYIDVDYKPAAKEIPGKEFLLDDGYVKQYDDLYRQLHLLYVSVNDTNNIDMDELNSIVDDKLPQLCDGAKAVSQIHNMSREGIYLIHHALHVAILAWLIGHWLHWPASIAT